MGLVDGLMMGLGGAMQGLGQYGQMEAQKQMDVDKAQAIEKMKIEFADKEREKMATAMGAAEKGLLGRAMEENAGRLYQGSGGPTPAADEMSPEEQAMFAPTDSQKRQAYRDAGKQLGYISPEKAATLDRADEGDSTKAMLAEGRNATQMLIADSNQNTRMLIAGMVAAAKAGKDAPEGATQRLAEALRADEKAQGRNISLKEALALMRKETDDVGHQATIAAGIMKGDPTVSWDDAWTRAGAAIAGVRGSQKPGGGAPVRTPPGGKTIKFSDLK